MILYFRECAWGVHILFADSTHSYLLSRLQNVKSLYVEYQKKDATKKGQCSPPGSNLKKNCHPKIREIKLTQERFIYYCSTISETGNIVTHSFDKNVRPIFVNKNFDNNLRQLLLIIVRDSPTSSDN